MLHKGEIDDDLYFALKNSSHYYLNFEADYNCGEEFVEENTNRNIITDLGEKTPQGIPENGIAAPKGYFLPEGFVVDKSNSFSMPYSYVLTGYRFSSVLTQNSLGYTFFDNARERRICSFYGDAHFSDNGERLVLSFEDELYDLCAVSKRVRYEKGYVVYEGEIKGNAFSVTVVISPKYPVKLIKIESANPITVDFIIKPVMGDSVSPVNGIEVLPFDKGNNKCLLFRNPFGMTFPEGVGFAGACGGGASPKGCSLRGEGTEILFFLGACQTQIGAQSISSLISLGFFQGEFNKAMDFAQSFLPNIKVETENPLSDRLFNFFLPYQVSACRFYARGSFYQSGGAYGFRDQLQDCLALVYSNPMAVRTHLIRCCAHQYEDGTVMHWWHTRNFNKVNRGIKSKCSDDLLYLPLVLSDYLEKTNDYSLLEISVYYLSSPPLGNQSERYEQPQRSEIKESVYEHCKRVFRGGLKLGKHGLILIGSCDWNDAFSLVGEMGEGESVFSSLLYIISAERFIPICERCGDYETISFLTESIEKLKSALEHHAFRKDRYIRAICDDGSVLGAEESEECKIDILSQSLGAIAGLNAERVKMGLKTAFSRLYDEKNRIFKLFSPAFSNGRARVGYIRGYVSGIRENGGQYSHGALWGALGCIKAGMYNEALMILDCVNPVSRISDKALAKKYKVEPYVISADIYSGEFGGRGGWSWYTGASSWFYKIMLEEVYGIKLSASQTLISAKPIVPFKAELLLDNRRLVITASAENKQALINGEEVELPLEIPKGDNRLEIALN